MPALCPTMTEGKLAKWLKSEGDYLEPGDAIAEIETDKATMEVEAVDPGFLKQILVAEDTENVPVNTPIAIMSDTVAEQLTEEQLVDEQVAEETYSKNVNKQENTKGSKGRNKRRSKASAKVASGHEGRLRALEGDRVLSSLGHAGGPDHQE